MQAVKVDAEEMEFIKGLTLGQPMRDREGIRKFLHLGGIIKVGTVSLYKVEDAMLQVNTSNKWRKSCFSTIDEIVSESFIPDIDVYVYCLPEVTLKCTEEGEPTLVYTHKPSTDETCLAVIGPDMGTKLYYEGDKLPDCLVDQVMESGCVVVAESVDGLTMSIERLGNDIYYSSAHQGGFNPANFHISDDSEYHLVELPEDCEESGDFGDRLKEIDPEITIERGDAGDNYVTVGMDNHYVTIDVGEEVTPEMAQCLIDKGCTVVAEYTSWNDNYYSVDAQDGLVYHTDTLYEHLSVFTNLLDLVQGDSDFERFILYSIPDGNGSSEEKAKGSEDPEELAVVLMGNLPEGFSIVGPFKSFSAASVWADGNEAWITELTLPTGFEGNLEFLRKETWVIKENCNPGIFTKIYEWLFGTSVVEFEFTTVEGVWYTGKFRYTGHGSTLELRLEILRQVEPMVDARVMELLITKV